MKYGEMDLTDAKGTLLVKAGRVKFVKSSLKLLDGTANFNGFYSTEDMSNPNTGFYMSIKDFDIPTTYKTFNTIQKLAPGAQFMEGKFSSEFSFASNLMHNYELDLNTIAGKGSIQSKQVKLSNSPLYNKIADLAKSAKLKEIMFKDVDLNFEFKDGKVVVEPFDVKIGKGNISISGENGFDQTINYKMVMTVATAKVFPGGGETLKGLSQELSQITGKDTKIGSNLNFNIVFKVFTQSYST